MESNHIAMMHTDMNYLIYLDKGKGLVWVLFVVTQRVVELHDPNLGSITQPPPAINIRHEIVTSGS